MYDWSLSRQPNPATGMRRRSLPHLLLSRCRSFLEHTQEELLREHPARVRSADSLQGQGLLWGISSWIGSMLGWKADPMDEDTELVVVDDLKVCTCLCASSGIRRVRAGLYLFGKLYLPYEVLVLVALEGVCIKAEARAE